MDVLRHATSIVQKLDRAGHIAYFAGGWVRDYVMGHPSEDIDIATSALPNEIMNLFSNTILVGLAFGVVIVVIEGHQYEVATFRKDLHYIDGRHPVGIEPSTPLEDALRRDFTINGMFYDPIKGVLHDFVHGREDITKGLIRAIGDPHERFFEDRLRMLRAFRFAARFSFAIDLETQDAIKENVDKLFPSVAMERVWQEFNKMAAYPRFDQALVDMHRLSLLEIIFPELKDIHLHDLRTYIEHFSHFPESAPPILYLMELFPNAPLDQKIEISKRIKATNRDIKLIEFSHLLFHSLKDENAGKPIEEYVWVHLYAHAECQLCLDVIASRYPKDERAIFIQKHHERIQRLEPHIKRIQEAKPLITAATLIQQGIRPGKQMGMLMKEAEKLAINKNLNDAESILALLKTLPLWNQKHDK